MQSTKLPFMARIPTMYFGTPGYGHHRAMEVTMHTPAAEKRTKISINIALEKRHQSDFRNTEGRCACIKGPAFGAEAGSHLNHSASSGQKSFKSSTTPFRRSRSAVVGGIDASHRCTVAPYTSHLSGTWYIHHNSSKIAGWTTAVTALVMFIRKIYTLSLNLASWHTRIP